MGKPEERDENGRTRLMLAVMDQPVLSIKQVLAFDAIRRGDLFLIDNNGRTALFYAAGRGDEDIVWILLNSLTAVQRGALLGVKDKLGRLAENWAELQGKDEISRILSVERQRIDFFE